MTSGNATKLNRLPGIGSAFYTDEQTVMNMTTVLPKGAMVYKSDIRQLCIADGTSTVGNLTDHTHTTLAPLGHSHMYGTNEPWLMTNPRLWYTADLENHPELVALDGSDLDNEKAVYLAEAYPGCKLLTTPITNLNSNDGFNNGDVSVSTAVSSGLYMVGSIFGEPLSYENMNHVTDQWLSGRTSLTQEEIITVQYLKGATYRPTDYLITKAFGVAADTMASRPTPRDWVLECSNDGSSWVVVDTQEDIEWGIVEFTKGFVVPQNTEVGYYSYMRIRITGWNAALSLDMDGTESEPNLSIGIRRLYIYGRKENVFSLPSITSPSDEFTYVVPYRDLNVGLKHEDVGDLGVTSVLPANLPAYRIPSDGSSKLVSSYPLLYAAIGHRYDTYAAFTMASTIGSTNGDTWTATADPMVYVDMTITDGSLLGYYIWNTNGKNTPSELAVEGYLNGTWVLLQSFEDITAADFTNGTCTFFLDTTTEDAAYTKYRFTVVSWNNDGTGYGCILSPYTHETGEFYIPLVESVDGTAYIVSNNTAVDVSSIVVAQLQSDVITLANTVASIVAQNQTEV